MDLNIGVNMEMPSKAPSWNCKCVGSVDSEAGGLFVSCHIVCCLIFEKVKNFLESKNRLTAVSFQCGR